MRSLVSFVFLTVLVGVSYSALAADASTSDFSTNSSQCGGSSASHYAISDAGMLSIVTQWKCTSNTGRAEAGICQLDQTLKCRSEVQFADKSGHPIDLSGYSVGLQGVTAAGVLHPWIDAQAASIIVTVVRNAAARDAAKNQAAIDNMGGEDNFKQFLMAGMCRVTLIAVGMVQPTAKEIAQDENNKKNNAKVVVDTKPEQVENCKTITRKFCGRSDLPAALTQTADYKTVCDRAP
jgi:hypothetical protein